MNEMTAKRFIEAISGSVPAEEITLEELNRFRDLAKLAKRSGLDFNAQIHALEMRRLKSQPGIEIG